MTFAPVGIRCPEHANIGAVKPVPAAHAAERASGATQRARGAGDDGADRDQRRRLRDHRRAGRRDQPSRRRAVLEVGAAGCRGLERRLVAARHRDVPPRQHPPPRSSTCSPSTGSARSSSRRSARRASCSSTSSRASPARRERSGSAPQFAVTVGASGAIFGLIGALLILEYLATGSLMGQAMVLILVNLALTFAVPGISIGGHIGGLAGGIVATYALMRFRMPPNRALGLRDRRRASASPASLLAYVARARLRRLSRAPARRRPAARPARRRRCARPRPSFPRRSAARSRTWRSSARCRPAPDPAGPGPGSIAITTTARRPTTFERVRRHVRHPLHHPQQRLAREQQRDDGDDREHDHLDPDVAAEQRP